MTGIKRLCDFVENISPVVKVLGVTKVAYDREHREAANACLRDFLSDIAEQIKLEHAEDCFRMGERAAEDAEAIAWVCYHGGIDEVKDAWNVRSNLDRQLERAKAKVERQQRHIEAVQRKCRERQEHICELNKLKRAYVDALNGVCKRLGLTDGTGLPDMPEVIWTELDRRLMPEGMEWPRFEDGEPIRIGGEFMGKDGKTYTAKQVQFIGKCFSLYDFCDRKPQFDGFYGERVRRPAPKVLDADGVEIRKKCDVWWICEGDERGVHAEHLRVETIGPDGLVECSPYNGGTWVSLEPSELYVKEPVLAADGKPLREGETVYHVADGRAAVVREVREGGAVVEPVDGRPCGRCRADYLTHERHDSWERWREEWQWPPVKYCKLVLGVDYDQDMQLQESFDAQGEDLVRRAKALAGRDAS